MKPDWKDAPEGFNVLGKEADGTYLWFRHTPEEYCGQLWNGGGNKLCGEIGDSDGKCTLEYHP